MQVKTSEVVILYYMTALKGTIAPDFEEISTQKLKNMNVDIDPRFGVEYTETAYGSNTYQFTIPNLVAGTEYVFYCYA